MMAASLALTAIWQVGSTALSSDMVRFAVTTGIALLAISVIAIYVFRGLKPKTDKKVSDELRSEFEKSKDALLLAAQAKRSGKEADDAAKREVERESRERDLLKENVDAQRVVGANCPLCNLEMAEDQELVIDPYTGQGYHFSCFLHDWPHDSERPRYIYRHPYETVLKSEDLLRSF